MLEIPTVTWADSVWGKNLLPPMKDIPEGFKGYHGNSETAPYIKFVEHAFFKGSDMDGLTEKAGVDRVAAIRAIRACMKTWVPKHEHKIAGCAYMLSEWFDFKQEEN